MQETGVQSNSATLEQLVVTADRHPQNSQVVPIMMVSISSDDAAAFSITDVKTAIWLLNSAAFTVVPRSPQ